MAASPFLLAKWLEPYRERQVGMQTQGFKFSVIVAVISNRARALAFGLVLVSGALGQAQAAEDAYAEQRDTLETCFACHGENGASTEAEFPILAGQHFYYLYVQLKDFKAGRRASAVMEEFVVGLTRSSRSWPGSTSIISTSN